jgi:hypothetical protein
MSKIVKDVKNYKKLRHNQIFMRSNYGLHSLHSSQSGGYNKQTAIYCYIENVFCGLCFSYIQYTPYFIKIYCLVPLLVLNKKYKYKLNKNKNKDKYSFNIEFIDKKYKCINLSSEPYYKWNIDVRTINAETECGYELKYCVNITRIGKL